MKGTPHTLELALPEGRGVAGNQDELGLSRPQRLESRPVAKDDLSGLHNKRKLAVDAVSIGLGPERAIDVSLGSD